MPDSTPQQSSEAPATPPPPDVQTGATTDVPNPAPSPDPSPTQSSAAPVDELPRISPIIEPFHSAGGPPPVPNAVKLPHHHRGIWVIIIIVLMLVAAGAGYVLVSGNLGPIGSLPGVPAKSTPTPTPVSVTVDAAALDQSVDETSSALNDVATALSNADSALDDKQGDLSE